MHYVCVYIGHRNCGNDQSPIYSHCLIDLKSKDAGDSLSVLWDICGTENRKINISFTFLYIVCAVVSPTGSRPPSRNRNIEMPGDEELGFEAAVAALGKFLLHL